MRMARSRGGIEVTAVVWSKSGKILEAVGFEPDLRGRVGGRGTGHLTGQLGIHSQRTLHARPRSQGGEVWGQGVLTSA